MIKDQKADQEVWDKLCDNWETLNSGKTYEEFGESDALYDFVVPTADLIGKAFGISVNRNIQEIKKIAKDRYGLGDRVNVLFQNPEFTLEKEKDLIRYGLQGAGKGIRKF